MLTGCRFQNLPLEFLFQNLPFSKSAGKKMCRFRVNGRPIRHIFHRFQNVPASCERSLSFVANFRNLCDSDFNFIRITNLKFKRDLALNND